LKEVASVRPSNVDKKSVEGERPVRLCNYVDVYKNDQITADMEFMEATATDTQIDQFSLRGGDVVITKDSETWDDIAVPAYVPHTIEGLVCGYHLALIRPNLRCLDGAYLARCFAAEGLVDQFRIAANGITRYGLDTQSIKCAVFPVPPLPEQRAIAEFLDRETSRVDALIGHKEQLIALLEEKWQAVVTHTVTRGIDQTVPLKDSGIPWIGLVPKHWPVTQLRYIIRPGTMITYGIVQAGPNIVDGVPYIRTSDMAGNELAREGYLRTSPAIDNSYRRSRVHEGDIVIAIRATVGKALPVPAYLDGANLTQGTAKISSGASMDRDYLLWSLRSSGSQQRFEALAKGATFREITLDMLRRFSIPFPPLDEQRRIAENLNRLSRQYSSTISRIRDGIARLEEYRAALISAAVTGQIDVRGEVTP
jgi:type I restriction enzyme S subunit